MTRRGHTLFPIAALSLALAGCGGEDGGSGQGASTAPVAVASIGPLDAPEERNLSVDDVKQVLAQAVEEAEARGEAATIAVVDRVGNVLAVFRMTGATLSTRVRPGPAADQGPLPPGTLDGPMLPPGFAAGNLGAQGILVPRALAAISKALTGAYLSSAGNAFSTRTASMIVQEHFPPSPATIGLESGPLFGVQLSQLPCSDLNTRFDPGGTVTIGPKRAPLGLSADPGGLPLYIDGVVVGGIGVSADADYGFDDNVLNEDTDAEELIAVAGSFGFAPRNKIQADRITVDGTSLRFTDKGKNALQTKPRDARAFDVLDGVSGALIEVPGYYGAGGPTVLAGQAYGAEASGIRPAAPAEFADDEIYVLTDGSGLNRFAPRGGTDGAAVAQPLTEAEVRRVLEEAFGVMRDARAQIRQPLNSRAQVTISVVDTHGAVLGMVRGPDAPIFGIDVSLQKARTAAFFSNAAAADDLLGATVNPALNGGMAVPDPMVSDFVDRVRTFLNDPAALTGTVAFADRSGGNLSRPFFPDGERGTDNGPLSRPFNEWSIFATGLQDALVIGNLAQHIGFVYDGLMGGGGGAMDTRGRCSFVPDIPGVIPAQNRLQNGIQIFPGSVPIYRGTELVGAIGVSGDGIDQDDMISFLGVHRAGQGLGTINNAPSAIRADRITVSVNGEPIRLRYVNCPFNPFVGSDEQNVCQGK